MPKSKWDFLVMLCEAKHPRYINGKEIPNWQQGPSILEALDHLAWKGWEIFFDTSALWRGEGKLVLRRPKA
jgi:hypothetical protein